MALAKLPNLPAHPAKDFTTRLHERVLSPTGSAYAAFDPTKPTSYLAFINALRKDHDALDETRVYANDTNKHVVAVDAREAAHHAAQDARLDAIEARLDEIPFP